MAPPQTAVAIVPLRMTFAIRRSSFRPGVAAFADHAMATAQIGEDRFVPLATEFLDGLRVRLSGGSDVVLKKQCNTCRHRDYVGQASRYQSPFGVPRSDHGFRHSRTTRWRLVICRSRRSLESNQQQSPITDHFEFSRHGLFAW